MMHSRAIGVLLLGFLASPARATPYWVHWDASQGYPEDNGWHRVHSEPPGQRWFEGETLFIDSRQQPGIYDYSRMSFPGIGTLDPGETFVARWRLKVDYRSNFYGDPGVIFTSDEHYAVGFVSAEDRIWSLYQPNTWAPFEPGRFHELEVRTADLRFYELYIDNSLALSGPFYPYGFTPRFDWGDLGTSQSLSEWSWTEFGIVPEASGLYGATLLLATLRRR